MKRLLFICISIISLMFCGEVSFAQTPWTVQTVPNTRLESNDIHVSDPDGYLSDSAEMNINTALCAIRDQADVFVVTLTSIGESEPKHFATRLFNYWGIGDAATDNGVLLLFVEDQHALEFETGYGAEATMTDARCQQIFTQTIVPFFRVGDYEGGLCAGVADIVDVYGGTIPVGLKTTLPSSSTESRDTKEPDDFSYLFGFFALFVFALPFVGIYFWLKKRGEGKKSASDAYRSFEENGATYIDGFKSDWSGSPWEGKGCLGGLLIGFSIFVIMIFVIPVVQSISPNLEEIKFFNRVILISLVLYLTWACFRHNHRTLKKAKELSRQSVNPKSVYEAAFNHSSNKVAMWMAPWIGWIYYLIFKKKKNQAEECCCPECGGTMRTYGNFNLPANHVAEMAAGALKFTPYRCGNGHVIVVKEHGKQFSKFSTCKKCGAYTLKKTDTKTIRNADYTQSGEKLETYVCQHCGDTFTKTVTIPKLVHYTSSSSYSGSSSSSRSYSSHSSSSRSSGGSHGGGRSGGGGYSGRW